MRDWLSVGCLSSATPPHPRHTTWRAHAYADRLALRFNKKRMPYLTARQQEAYAYMPTVTCILPARLLSHECVCMCECTHARNRQSADENTLYACPHIRLRFI